MSTPAEASYWGILHEQGLVRAHLPPDSRVLEVGTGSGQVALAIARTATLVATYEADPDLAASARALLGPLGVPVLAAAVAGEAGRPAQATFHRSDDWEYSSLYALPAGYATTRETIAVPVVGIGDAIARHGADALVLDCEGAEWGILRALSSPALDPHPIRTIMVEVHVALLGRERAIALDESVLRQGFRCLHREGFGTHVTYAIYRRD